MNEDTAAGWSIERVRTVTLRMGAALESRDPVASQQLAAAAGEGAIPAESLLLMRSALISTRAAWESLETSDLVEEGKAAIAAGKRLAIEETR